MHTIHLPAALLDQAHLEGSGELDGDMLDLLDVLQEEARTEEDFLFCEAVEERLTSAPVEEVRESDFWRDCQARIGRLKGGARLTPRSERRLLQADLRTLTRGKKAQDRPCAFFF